MEIADVVGNVRTIRCKGLGPAERPHRRLGAPRPAVENTQVVPRLRVIRIEGQSPAPAPLGFTPVLPGVGDAPGQHMEADFDAPCPGPGSLGFAGPRSEGLVDPRLSPLEISLAEGPQGGGEIIRGPHGTMLISREGLLRA